MRAQVRPGVTTRQLDKVAEQVIVSQQGGAGLQGLSWPVPVSAHDHSVGER
jgi:hypothetical protein